MLDLDNISHNCCPLPKGVSWPSPKVISPRPRSQCTHIQNLCPGYNSSLPCWISIIFHTILVHDSRVCHDLDLRSYIQGQGHSAHTPEIHIWAVHDTGVVVAGGICPVRTCLVHFVFWCFWRAPPGRSTGHIKMNLRMTCIWGNRCIERMIIWKKNGGGTRKGSLTIIMWNITQIRQEGKKLWAQSRCEQTVRVIPIFPQTLCVYVWGGLFNNN